MLELLHCGCFHSFHHLFLPQVGIENHTKLKVVANKKVLMIWDDDNLLLKTQSETSKSKLVNSLTREKID